MSILTLLPDVAAQEFADSKYETADEQRTHTIDQMLRLPGVLSAVIANIPDEWEYAESVHGDNPTKHMFAYAWLIEETERPSGLSKALAVQQALYACYDRTLTEGTIKLTTALTELLRQVRP